MGEGEEGEDGGEEVGEESHCGVWGSRESCGSSWLRGCGDIQRGRMVWTSKDRTENRRVSDPEYIKDQEEKANERRLGFIDSSNPLLGKERVRGPRSTTPKTQARRGRCRQHDLYIHQEKYPVFPGSQPPIPRKKGPFVPDKPHATTTTRHQPSRPRPDQARKSPRP